MDIRSVSKAVAGGLSAGAGTVAAGALIIPPDVAAPWWGYVVAFVASAVVGYVGVWIAPANKRG